MIKGVDVISETVILIDFTFAYQKLNADRLCLMNKLCRSCSGFLSVPAGSAVIERALKTHNIFQEEFVARAKSKLSHSALQTLIGDVVLGHCNCSSGVEDAVPPA